MNSVETIIAVILLLMGIPEQCNKMGRPALVYSAYVIFGLFIGGLLTSKTVDLLQQAGAFGFILLLFSIGLEIDLPGWNETLRALRRAFIWIVIQVPFWLLLGFASGLSPVESLIGAVALSGCSVGMAFTSWMNFPGSSDVKRKILNWMVALEVMAIILLSVSGSVVKHGLGWSILGKIAGMSVAVLLTAVFAPKVLTSLRWLLARTIHWRVHFIVLAVLMVAAIGERLGLSAAKAAFFLGLFFSRTTHEGMALEHHLKPISENFLIPIFFVSLGTTIPFQAMASLTGFWAIACAGVILGWRHVLFHRIVSPRLSIPVSSGLLVGPNLTMAAVAVEGLPENERFYPLKTWLLLTALYMTIVSVMLLPRIDSSQENLRKS